MTRGGSFGSRLEDFLVVVWVVRVVEEERTESDGYTAVVEEISIL